MTDLEKFVSILHSAGTPYFAYSDCDSVGCVKNIIAVYEDGVVIFHKFNTYFDEFINENQVYLGCSVEKEWSSLDELVREAMTR